LQTVAFGFATAATNAEFRIASPSNPNLKVQAMLQGWLLRQPCPAKLYLMDDLMDGAEFELS
jgi:hypothetical protein